MFVENDEESEESTESAHDIFFQKWSWLHLLYQNFCNGDYFKLEKCFEMRIIECFNFLGYLNDLQQLKK